MSRSFDGSQGGIPALRAQHDREVRRQIQKDKEKERIKKLRAKRRTKQRKWN